MSRSNSAIPVVVLHSWSVRRGEKRNTTVLSATVDSLLRAIWRDTTPTSVVLNHAFSVHTAIYAASRPPRFIHMSGTSIPVGRSVLSMFMMELKNRNEESQVARMKDRARCCADLFKYVYYIKCVVHELLINNCLSRGACTISRTFYV